jgi:putative DNA primase/helicase
VSRLRAIPGTEPDAARGDLAVADRFVREVGADFRHVYGLGWFTWTGSAWSPCERGEQVEAAKTIARAMLHGEDSATARAAGQEPRVRGALRLAESDPAVALGVGALDDPGSPLLATPGGTVDLRTGALRPARREDLISRLCAVAPAAEVGPGWSAFLERVQPDPALRAFLARLAGAAAVGGNRPGVLPIFRGEGANGKTVFVRVLAAVLGDYAWTAPLDLLMSLRAGGPAPEVVALRGRRFVTVAESPEDGRLAAERVKYLTGGDTITARTLHREPVSFRPAHTIFLATNHRPRVADEGEAVWRRLLLIPWGEVIPERERDPDLAAALIAGEGPGVLRWIIDGAVAYLSAGGLEVPDPVRAATGDYREREDAFSRFLAERCIVTDAGVVRAGALLAAYREWGRVAGADPLTDSGMRDRLERRGFRRVSREGRVSWTGLHLRSDDRQDGAE